MGRAQVRLSLKARALQLLAQRDQSRLEMRRKLLYHAERATADQGAGEGEPDARSDEVEAVLDWLEANRYLCAERFAESRVHAREERFGNQRIKTELAQHGVKLPADVAEGLAESEFRRAAAVRMRRFVAPPRDAAERAAQSRFLAGRGFSADVIHRLMRQVGEAALVTGRDEPASPG